MTRDEILKRFPNASQSTIRANLSDNSGLRPVEPKHAQRKTLVDPSPGEKTGGAGVGERSPVANRFRVTYRVFSTRPCDFDNYHIKELQDLLVRAGMLPGDDWRTLQGEIVSYKAESKKHERTEITIEHVSEMK